ncbi:hypothetical protein [Acerihabitans arboris]|uniref:hypothetical protein n=1 Tax=Acerihabitans arboris TaxID=2691583 RepID=UPI001FE5DBAC|nr:hypothetical protein [Acerihabitans arboris]
MDEPFGALDELTRDNLNLIDAGMKKDDLISFPYEDQGVSTREDGPYVLEPKLKDPAFVAKMARFLHATYPGWREAVKNPAEAAQIGVDQDMSGAATAEVQQRQMENVAKLIANVDTARIGYLTPEAYRRTVDVLLKDGGAPVIKKDPGDSAMTHVIWDAAARIK